MTDIGKVPLRAPGAVLCAAANICMSTVQPAGFCHQVDNAVDQDNPHKLRTKIEIVAARKRKVGQEYQTLRIDWGHEQGAVLDCSD